MPSEPGPRMTIQTQLVLQALLKDPTREMYGLEICERAGLPSGTIHPILARLEKFGWLASWFEDVDPRKAGRPRRRYYRLSADGADKARTAIANAHVPLASLPNFRPGPAFGGGVA